ncbi:MAG: tetratricopeptide repeat protein, partial [Gemmatimonadetes bacterium]|nr:tetratricopeptide repeat protein [Gemmatimonadota bacterium]NIQ55085.1 tetratricopeptide repeat protein [Gemmatimonadota bacterium]NIU75270.1 tetratricopeptide repeat protein [Gammaproteobacteria bacterium]NIX45076.1 tetratricopeptide repeat protein [Gemmatimonadota bacterium]NIY09316.1 tetratricopeptide repeat protein [Gemmatimonadota bacterium]
RAGAGDLNAETLTTTSLPALRAFLEGESHYRRGRFAEAVQSFERAVAEDTSFAIALVRLSEAYGWLESQTSERMREYGERAEAHLDRLSPRYQFIMEGWSALNRGTADGVDALKEAVQKYPDDPEAWFLLAETYIHVGGATYGTI